MTALLLIPLHTTLGIKRTEVPYKARQWAFFTRFIAPVMLLLALSACTPSSYLVLLDSPNERPGAVVVRTAQGETPLGQTGQALALHTDGRMATPVSISPQRVQTDFADTAQMQPKAPMRFVLYFETAGTRLTPESEAKKPLILEAVGRYPAPDLSVIGHTDTVGSSAQNEALGRQRARFVANWLEAAGVNAVEIDVGSHGESNPLIPTADNVSEPQNRRVEVTVR